jgi:hypothetical protein
MGRDSAAQTEGRSAGASEHRIARSRPRAFLLGTSLYAAGSIVTGLAALAVVAAARRRAAGTGGAGTLRDLEMALYLVATTSVPAAAAYGLVAACSRGFREGRGRVIGAMSLGAGVISYASYFAGFALLLVWNLLRVTGPRVGGMIALIVPGLVLGFAVAAALAGVSRRHRRLDEPAG